MTSKIYGLAIKSYTGGEVKLVTGRNKNTKGKDMKIVNKCQYAQVFTKKMDLKGIFSQIKIPNNGFLIAGVRRLADALVKVQCSSAQNSSVVRVDLGIDKNNELHILSIPSNFPVDKTQKTIEIKTDESFFDETQYFRLSESNNHLSIEPVGGIIYTIDFYAGEKTPDEKAKRIIKILESVYPEDKNIKLIYAMLCWDKARDNLCNSNKPYWGCIKKRDDGQIFLDNYEIINGGE